MKNDSIRTLLAFALFWVGVLVTIWAYNYSPEKNSIRSESSVTAIALENFVKSSTPDTTPVDAEVVWIGTFFRRMTYGRLLLKSFDSDADYKYFVVEPDDVIEEGVQRYSPTTDNVRDGDVIKVTGRVSDWCYRNGVTDGDDNVVYGGCVPWVDVEKFQVVEKNYIHTRPTLVAHSNRFGLLKWWTAKIVEHNKHANIEVEYPQFIGGGEVANLNSYIRGVITDRVRSRKDEVKEWIVEKDNNYCATADTSDDGTLYECSVQLSSIYRVAAIINDVISMEIDFTDFTGGGNGNHDRPIVVNYDLKSDRVIKDKDLLCAEDSFSNLSLIINSYSKTSSFGWMSVSENREYAIAMVKNLADSEDFDNILLGYRGLSLVYPPYEIASGADGIIRVPVPYSLTGGKICLP